MTLPEVIFLNGNSSAGKSSIARELQALVPAPYMHFGIDHAIRRAPLRLHGHPDGFQFVPMPGGEMPMRLGEDGARVLHAWRRMMRTAVAEGLRLILDEVIFEAGMLEDWVAALDGADVFFVGVRCDFAELQRRELARGDRGQGQALAGRDFIHSHGDYDLEVDTTATSATACAATIAAAAQARGPGPTAFERLRVRSSASPA
jgi:chloramphenicol 3-O phosphotransferase